MVDIDRRAIEIIADEGESRSTQDRVAVLERYHGDRPGVPERAVAAYARELAAQSDVAFDADTCLDAVADRATDAASWQGRERFYELDGERRSRYPAPWHDRLAGESDPAAYLRFFRSTAEAFLDDQHGSKPGVTEDTLIEVLVLVGRLDRESAVSAIEAARDEGTIVEDADQHPRAGVYLADETQLTGARRRSPRGWDPQCRSESA